MVAVSLASGGPLKTDGPGEFRCETCGARCTRNQTNGEEYGHKYGCPEIPPQFERLRSAESGRHTYQPDAVATDGGER